MFSTTVTPCQALCAACPGPLQFVRSARAAGGQRDLGPDAGTSASALVNVPMKHGPNSGGYHLQIFEGDVQ